MSQRAENSYQAEYLKSLERRIVRSQLEHSYTTPRGTASSMGNSESTTPKGCPASSPKSNQPTSKKNIDYMIQKYSGKPSSDEADETVNSTATAEKHYRKSTKRRENANSFTLVNNSEVGSMENKVPKLTIKVGRKRKRSSINGDSPSTRPVSKRRRTTTPAKGERREPVNGLVESAATAVDDLRLKIEAKRAVRLLGKDYSSRRQRILTSSYRPHATDSAAINRKLDRTLKRLTIDGVCPDTTLQRTRRAEFSPKTSANSPKSGTSSPNVAGGQKIVVGTSASKRRASRQTRETPTGTAKGNNSPTGTTKGSDSPTGRARKSNGDSHTRKEQKEASDSPLNMARRPLRNSPHTNTTPAAESTTKSLKRKRAAKSLSPIFFKDTEKSPPTKKKMLPSRRKLRTKSRSEVSPSSVENNEVERQRPRKAGKPRHTRSLGSVLPPRNNRMGPRTPSHRHSAIPRPPGANSSPTAATPPRNNSSPISFPPDGSLSPIALPHGTSSPVALANAEKSLPRTPCGKSSSLALPNSDKPSPIAISHGVKNSPIVLQHGDTASPIAFPHGDKSLTPCGKSSSIAHPHSDKSPAIVHTHSVNSSPCPSPKLEDVAGPQKGSPRSVLSQLQSSSPKPFAYRMNGSPKLNGLPAVLSLNALSGIHPGLQDLPSLRPGFTAATSGSPSAVPHSPPTFPGSPGNKSSPRPKSLLLDDPSNPTSITTAGPFTNLKEHSRSTETSPMHSPTEKPLHSNSQSQTKRKMTLSETVEMLKQKSMNDFESEMKTRNSASPVSSEKSGRMSRRSSRSSTPNISPMKTEILTPISTPQLTPAPSPTATSGKVGKVGRRRHLFELDNDVLARWRDGLYYRVKILKIDEKQQKCELQYEDNSVSWSFFKDIHRGARDGEMICCVCMGETSDAPNEIVLCDNCGQGYHQNCHQPVVDAREVLDPDDEWCCRPCVFALSIKIGGAIKDGKYADQLARIKQVLPYDIDTLTWDTQHKMNVEQFYCYCGGPGIWYQKMLQCCRCKQWFHEACMQCLEQPLVMADSFYIFVCSVCNDGDEYIKRLAIAWSDLVHIALFNLTMQNNRKYFDFHDHILPWIDDNWHLLQANEYNNMDPMERYDKVEEALVNNKTRFSCGPEVKKRHAQWGLRVRVPPPRTKIDLPFSGKVTTNIMKTHKITGRRSKVFVPMVCKPPSKLQRSLVHQSATIQQNGDIQQKPRDSLELNVEQAAADHIGSPTQESPMISSPAMLKQSPVKTFILDRLIPAPGNYEPQNSAFLTEMEQIERQFDLQQKVRFWNFFYSLPKKEPVVASTSGGGDDEAVSTTADSPPVLQRVEPVTPSSGESPPMPQIDSTKKRGAAKPDSINVESPDQTPKTGLTDENGNGNRRSSRKKTTVQGQSSSSSLSSETSSKNSSNRDSLLPDCSLPLRKWKSVTQNYFGAFDRLCYGKGMHLVAKRCNQSGTDYLLVWDSLGFDKDEI